MNITISCTGCSIVAGFFYQLSSLNGNLKFFHSVKGITIILLTMIFYPLPSYIILLAAYDYHGTNAYIKEHFNNFYYFYSSVPSCHGLKLDFKAKAHYGLLAIQIFFVWFVASIVAFKIRQKLTSMKNILSSTTLKAKRQLLISLCFQMTIPFILIVFPLLLILLSVIADVKHFNTLSGYLMPLISLHSLVNALFIIFIITPYRRAVFNGIKKLLRIQETPAQTVIESCTKICATFQKKSMP